MFWVAFVWMIASPLVGILFLIPQHPDMLELLLTFNTEELVDYEYPDMSTGFFVLNALHVSLYQLFIFYAFREVLVRFHGYGGADHAIMCNAIFFAVITWIPETYGPGDSTEFDGKFFFTIAGTVLVCLVWGGLVLWLVRTLKPLAERDLFGLGESFVLMHRIQGAATLTIIGFCIAIFTMPIIWVQYLIIFFQAARAGGSAEWEEVVLDGEEYVGE